MNEPKYAVVRATLPGNNMNFTKLHDDEATAFAEAERLCIRERATFYVLKVLGKVEVKKPVVETVTEKFE